MKRSCWYMIVALFTCSLAIADVAPSSKEAQVPDRQKIYYFEHRLLPGWTHGTDGAFFSDLCKGVLDRIKAAAAEIAGPDFAQSLKVRAISPTCVLLTFQPPTDPALCFFAIVEKKGESYRYFTLELTEDLMGDGTKTVFGQWDAQGRHGNLGTRKYTDEASFIADLPKN